LTGANWILGNQDLEWNRCASMGERASAFSTELTPRPSRGIIETSGRKKEATHTHTHWVGCTGWQRSALAFSGKRAQVDSLAVSLFSLLRRGSLSLMIDRKRARTRNQGRRISSLRTRLENRSIHSQDTNNGRLARKFELHNTTSSPQDVLLSSRVVAPSMLLQCFFFF